MGAGWACMIDVTPDVVPTLGEDPAIEGFFICTGLSGHGFGIGPAIGRIMADVVTGRDPGHDLTRFRPDRFSDGSPIVGVAVLIDQHLGKVKYEQQEN